MFNIVDSTIGKVFAWIADLIFNIVAWIMGQVGYLLDYVIENLVLNMADMVNNIGAIDSLWQIFRDLGNIVFIGVLLYIAIRTILNVGNSFNTKRTLVRLVIVALLVNFSLFATKVVIDTSNVVALQFYNSIQVEDCGEGEDGCDISHFFADATNITSVQSAEAIDSSDAIQEADGINFRITIARILGTIFMLVTTFVMGAMAFLLVVRFGFLVLLMVASPLAFIAFILPSDNNWGNKWLDQLLSQSFFAPALFAMLYVVAALAADLESGITDGNSNLMEAIISPEGDNMGVILMFILMSFLMFYSLVIAKKIGGEATKKSIKLGKQARNWGQAKIAGAAAATARSTVGRASQRASESSSLKNAAKEGGIKGYASRQALKLSNWGAESSFDARNTRVGSMAGADDGKQRSGGFREVVKEKEERREREKEQIESMSEREKAAAEQAKLRKEQADKALEKKGKELDEERKDIDEGLQEIKNDFNNNKSQIDRKLNTIKTAIKDRDRLRKELEKAQKAGNVQKENEVRSKINNLTNDISGVDDASDLEQARNKAQNDRNNVQELYNEQKAKLDEEKRKIREEKKKAKKKTKDFKKEMDKITNVGKKRGEAFTEAMLTQKSALDTMRKWMGQYRPGDAAETTTTQGNRNFSIDNVSDISPKGEEDDDGNTRHDRIIDELSKHSNTSNQGPPDLSEDALSSYDLDDDDS